MAVHGRFGQPCPVCGTPVQRIVYAENETNYCPRCQTGGKLLADRSLSRLLERLAAHDRRAGAARGSASARGQGMTAPQREVIYRRSASLPCV